MSLGVGSVADAAGALATVKAAEAAEVVAGAVAAGDTSFCEASLALVMMADATACGSDAACESLCACAAAEAASAAALAAFAAAAYLAPEKQIQLQYTTTSPKLHKALGVSPSTFE